MDSVCDFRNHVYPPLEQPIFDNLIVSCRSWFSLRLFNPRCTSSAEAQVRSHIDKSVLPAYIDTGQI